MECVFYSIEIYYYAKIRLLQMIIADDLQIIIHFISFIIHFILQQRMYCISMIQLMNNRYLNQFAHIVYVLPSVWLASVLHFSGSPAAVPPSISASLSVCPVLSPVSASVETTEKTTCFKSCPRISKLCIQKLF